MKLKFKGYDSKTWLRDEALFSCANGNIGIADGVYMAGVYDTDPMDYGETEKYTGYPKNSQKIVNLPDIKNLKIFIDNEYIGYDSDKTIDFIRTLDMEKGVTSIEYVYKLKSLDAKISIDKITSFAYPEIFAMRCKVDGVSEKNKIDFISENNIIVQNHRNSNDPRLASGNINHLNIIENGKDIICVETKNTHIRVYIAIKTDIKNDTFIKYVAFSKISESDAKQKVKFAYETGFDELVEKQKEFLKNFWKKARVVVAENDIDNNDDISLQTKIDYAVYQLLSATPIDSSASIGAKGLTGEGYEGHYFWDSEMYCQPFFLVTSPNVMKQLLIYRYNHLNEARVHAREMGHEVGALFPWRTINGEEASGYYPAGVAQYHINADIARSFIKYYDATNDKKFLSNICEVLVELSRLYIDLGNFVDDEFHINSVTGPDEYTILVNDNYYTNAGAEFTFNNTIRLLSELKNYDKNEYDVIIKKLNLLDDEVKIFHEASSKMYFNYDKDNNIILQDDSFKHKKDININAVPESKRPLLLFTHPLNLNRYKICKQADTVLANVMFKKEEYSLMLNTFHYYEKVTIHDSTLSKSAFSIAAARVSEPNKAYDYLKDTLDIDLYDTHKNTKDGLHIANFGGIYLTLVMGFAGLSYKDDRVELSPTLPKEIRSISFNFYYKESFVNVYFTHDDCKINLIDGKPVDVYLNGKKAL